MKYVALLRGVNVGGNHRVPKAEFQAVLESLGFSDVVIYLNSGLLPGERIKAIAAAIPAEWTNDTPRPDKSGQKSDVLYLFDDINAPDILDKLGHKPEIETMLYVDGAVLANITRANQLKGSLQQLVGSKLYSQMTVRNVNTARKLAELAG